MLPEIKFSTCSELAFSSIKPNISPETACSFAWFLSKTAQLHLTGIRYLIPPRLRSIVLSILTLTGLQVVFYIINLWQTKSSRCFKVSFVSFLSLEKLLCVVSFSNKHSIPVSLKNGSRYKYWNLRFPKLKWNTFSLSTHRLLYKLTLKLLKHEKNEKCEGAGANILAQAEIYKILWNFIVSSHFDAYDINERNVLFLCFSVT